MQVRCVNNDGLEENLTIGWFYPVLEEGYLFYTILDDKGVETTYLKNRFTLIEPILKPTTLFEVIDGETVPIPETLQPLNGDYIVFKGVKYQIVSLTHDVDQGVKIYKMEIVKCK